MPVDSATPVRVIPRRVRAHLSRGATWSSAVRPSALCCSAGGVRSIGSSHSRFPETPAFVGPERRPLQSGRMTRYDGVVIGGGAAGLSAALVLSRARRKVLVVDAGSPRNAPASHMHGFLSRDGLPPRELLALGRREVTAYGGEIRTGAVTGSAPHGGAGFHVVLDDRQRISARRLLVGTGLRDELPDVPGLRERWARDVLHCPYCHGHEVRDRRLGVVGRGPGAVRYAQIVRQWTHDLVYFTPPDS